MKLLVSSEMVEDITTVRKIIPQVVSHASKLLRHPSPDLKKLEVRLKSQPF